MGVRDTGHEGERKGSVNYDSKVFSMEGISFIEFKSCQMTRFAVDFGHHWFEVPLLCL
jgi:hypothetical protein